MIVPTMTTANGSWESPIHMRPPKLSRGEPKTEAWLI